MASSKSLSSLLARSSIDDHEEILRAAEQTLKRSKDDTNAQHARVVALLNLDRYEDAVKAVEDVGEPFKQSASLEYAYALYKTGKLAEAKEIASRVSDRRSMKHLEAQAAYRLEQFSDAVEIYKALSAPNFALEDESSDVRINMGATDAQLAWRNKFQSMTKSKPDRADLEHFDTAFNAACSYIAQGELKQAEFLLKRAKDLCNAAEELAEEDKVAELLPITIQQIYVLALLDRQKEAEELCRSVSISEISDSITRHIASTNKLFLSQSSNPYRSLREFRSGSNVGIKEQPFQFQASLLRQNELALDLAAGKLSQFQAGTSSSSGEGSDHTYGVFIAAAHARNETGKAAIKKILPLLDKRPEDIGLMLTAVQLHILSNNLESATSLVESFLARLRMAENESTTDLGFAPGLVSLLVSLYCQLNRISQAKDELLEASRHWKRSKGTQKESTTEPEMLLKAAGVALVDGSSEDGLSLSREIFAELSKKNDSDAVVAAGLASSAENLEVIDKTEALLPSTNKLIGGIDAAALEEAGVVWATRHTATPAGRKRGPPDLSAQPKAKKKRSGKLPKDYDPNKKPDPERWLPLRDRSTWRPNKKKKKGKGGGAGGGMSTQGGIVNDDSRPGTPGQTQQQQPPQRPTGQSSSKKKKGK